MRVLAPASVGGVQRVGAAAEFGIGGGEWKIDSFINISDVGLSPSYGFNAAETAQPLYGQTLPSGTAIGYNWASFLLGGYDSVSIGDSVNPQYRRAAWGFYSCGDIAGARRLLLRSIPLRPRMSRKTLRLLARTLAPEPLVRLRHRAARR